MRSVIAKNLFLLGPCFLLSVGACAPLDPSGGRASPAISQDSLLLTRDAYLEAIDISLSRIRGNVRRVWIDGPGAAWLTAADMRLRRAKRGNGAHECPGAPALWVSAPVRRSVSRIDLNVVERSPRGTLGNRFEFVCTDGQCRLKDDAGTNELIVSGCATGIEFGARPPVHPLTQSVQ